MWKPLGIFWISRKLPRCNWIAQRDNCHGALQQLGKEKLAKRTKPKSLSAWVPETAPSSRGCARGPQGERSQHLPAWCGAGRRSNICSLVLNKGGCRASKAEPYKFPPQHHAQDGELLAWSLTARGVAFPASLRDAHIVETITYPARQLCQGVYLISWRSHHQWLCLNNMRYGIERGAACSHSLGKIRKEGRRTGPDILSLHLISTPAVRLQQLPSQKPTWCFFCCNRQSPQCLGSDKQAYLEKHFECMEQYFLWLKLEREFMSLLVILGLWKAETMIIRNRTLQAGNTKGTSPPKKKQKKKKKEKNPNLFS